MHEIMNDKRMYARKTPWHHRGITVPQGLTVREAADVIGLFDVQKVYQPIICPFTGNVIEHDNYLIVRQPVDQEINGVVLGRPVSKDFEIITPRMAVEAVHQAWRDENGNPALIDAMGFLGNGDRMWVTARMPDFVVKTRLGGRIEAENYILYWNPLSPDAASYVMLVTVLVVCRNTAELAIDGAKMSIAIQHHDGALERLRESLEETWLGMNGSIAESAETVEMLVNLDFTKDQMIKLTNDIFRMPKPPRVDGNFKTDYSDRLKNYEYRRDYVSTVRNVAVNLYDGGFTGSGIPGIEGTGFAALMAMTELATHMKSNAVDPLDSAFIDIIEGDRRSIIHKTKESLLELV